SHRRSCYAKVARIEIVLGECSPAHFPDMRVPSGCELIEAVIASEHQCGRATETKEICEKRRLGGVCHTRCGRLGSHGVAKRSKVVKHGLHTEFSAYRRNVLEAR